MLIVILSMQLRMGMVPGGAIIGAIAFVITIAAETAFVWRGAKHYEMEQRMPTPVGFPKRDEPAG